MVNIDGMMCFVSAHFYHCVLKLVERVFNNYYYSNMFWLDLDLQNKLAMRDTAVALLFWTSNDLLTFLSLRCPLKHMEIPHNINLPIPLVSMALTILPLVGLCVLCLLTLITMNKDGKRKESTLLQWCSRYVKSFRAVSKWLSKVILIALFSHWNNKMMSNYSTTQKQSRYWYWLNEPIKMTSKTVIIIGFASHLPHALQHLILLKQKACHFFNILL